MLVDDLMSTDVVTVPARASIRGTVGRMLSTGADAVVVVDSEGNPGGLVTRDDIVHVVYQADKPPEEIRVVAVAHAPALTLSPSITVRKAVRRMCAENVRVALVVDGLDVEGIVRARDVLDHLSVLLQQATDARDDSSGGPTA